jgi:hypothetical protein
MESINELGFYTLAGRQCHCGPGSTRDAEALGLGSAFVSERWNIKEACTLSGAVGAVSTRLGIATAATNHNTRHPAVTASFATTMHRLSGGRFALGLGRGIEILFRVYGIPQITTAQVEDFPAPDAPPVARRDDLFGHDGRPAAFRCCGSIPISTRRSRCCGSPSRPRSLALGGRVRRRRAAHPSATRRSDARRGGEALRKKGSDREVFASGRACDRRRSPRIRAAPQRDRRPASRHLQATATCC